MKNLNLKLSLKAGKLVVALNKPQVKALSEASDLTTVVADLAPLDPDLQEHAKQAAAHLTAIIAATTQAGNERSVLDAIDAVAPATTD